MPSEQPSSDNDYQVGPDIKVSVAVWNAVFASLQARLNAMEAIAATFEDAVSEEAVGLATDTFNNSVVPQLTDIQATMTALQEAIGIAEDQLAALQSGGVLAENVPVSATTLYPAGTSTQQAFEIVEAAFENVEAELTTAATNLSEGLAEKLGKMTDKATQAQAEAGQDNSKFLTSLRGAQQLSALAVPPGWDLVIEDRKASGTNGTNALANTFNLRDLNTVVVDNGRVDFSLSGNEITVNVGGTFQIDARGPAFETNEHKLVVRLNGSDVILGTSEYAGVQPIQSASRAFGKIEVDSGDTISLWHFVRTASSLGYNASYSGNPTAEIYAQIFIKRIS